MPACATHSFFAKDVYDILPENICDKLDVSKINMYALGINSLKYYNLLSFSTGKKIREFETYFHNNKTQDFFINLLSYMKDNNINDTDTYSFLFGFICHYALDVTINPYIVYRSGVFDKKDPSTYKYNNVHLFMETFIDNDMIRRRTDKNPYIFEFDKFCFNINPFSEDLNKTIDMVFENTFNISNMSSIYFKSLKQMKRIITVYRRDPYGIKKFFYKLLDTFTPKRMYRFEAISYHYLLEDRHDYLNNTHTIWRNPTTYNMTSEESFVDLYLKAIKMAKVIMCACEDYLNNKDIDLEIIFDNSSYITGLNCKKNKELKYFDF